MSWGEFLTRSTVWISIVAYTIGCVLFATARRDRWVRLAWTARQTDAVVGINWGGGLFINYAVVSLWFADVAWWWFAGLGAYRRRPWMLTLIWHSFLIFIIFNATVVFKDGLTRWIGLLVSLTLCLSWALISRQRSTVPTLF